MSEINYSMFCKGEVLALSAALLRRDALGVRGVLRRVDVEERVNRLVRPVGHRDAVSRGPRLDLAQILDCECVAQILAQRQRPQANDRMAPFAGAGTREWHPRAHLAPGLMQPIDQVV